MKIINYGVSKGDLLDPRMFFENPYESMQRLTTKLSDKLARLVVDGSKYSKDFQSAATGENRYIRVTTVVEVVAFDEEADL